MKNILAYLDFFSNLNFVYSYEGNFPIPEKLNVNDWDFLECNGKSLAEFDDEMRAFNLLVSELLKQKPPQRPKQDILFERETAHLKANGLLARIKVRKRMFHGVEFLEDNQDLVYFYSSYEGISAYYRVHIRGAEAHDIQVDNQELLALSSELVSIDIKWLQEILTSLVAYLESSKMSLQFSTQPHATSLPGKTSSSKRSTIPLNFVSKHFQKDVVTSFYESLVKLGYVEEGEKQKRAFCSSFSISPLKIPLGTKIKWKGEKGLLKALIRVGLGQFDELFNKKELNTTKWDTVDLIFEYTPPLLSKTRADDKHAKGEKYKPLEEAIEKALKIHSVRKKEN
jgi:hypothetical protein